MKTCDLPAYIIADLIKTKQISAVEVLEHTLERIRQVDGRTGQVDAPEAQSEEDLSTRACLYTGDRRVRPEAGGKY